LKKRGFTGQALLDEVNRRKQQVDAALAEMVQEALEEYRRGESFSHDEVFKLEDDR
jgi:predicted transcriptional regulator